MNRIVDKVVAKLEPLVNDGTWISFPLLMTLIVIDVVFVRTCRGK